MKNKCSHALDVIPYLQNQLEESARRHMSEHVAQCAECRPIAESFSGVAEKLRTLPVEKVSAGLDQKIIAAASEKPRLVFLSFFAKAALFLFLIGSAVAWWFSREEPSLSTSIPSKAVSVEKFVAGSAEKEQAIQNAVMWLEQVQESDGRWDAERWGAQRNYTVGVTSLSLMALLSKNSGASSVFHGVDFLLSQDKDMGCIWKNSFCNLWI